jgi:hypothetical protein
MIFIALAATFWTVYSLFGHNDPTIDLNFNRVDLERSRAVIESGIFALLATLLLIFRKLLLGPALITLALASVFYAGQTSRSISANSTALPPQSTVSSVYSLSAGNNLLLIQMDGFQAGYFHELLERDLELDESLDGFHFFPDTLAVASEAGPYFNAAIHTGYQYKPLIPINNIQADYLDGGSIFSKMSMAGADVLIMDRDILCPAFATCINSGSIARNTAQVHLAETIFAIDSALLIMAPEALKNLVYRKGRWLLGSQFAGGAFLGAAEAVLEDHAFLELFAEKVHLNQAGNSVRYIKLNNVNAPARLNADCKVTPGQEAFSKQTLREQASCSLHDLKGVINSLKSRALYDNTVIVVMAGIGAMRVNGIDEEHSKLLESANPLLLIKPRNSIGPLQINKQPVKLSDMPKTLCNTTELCRWPTGTDLFKPGNNPDPTRHYLVYSPDQYQEHLGLVFDGQRYQLSGPVNLPDSWQQIISNTQHVEVGKLTFSSLDDSDFFGDGWGVVELDPTAGNKRWVFAKSAGLTIALPPNADYLFDFTVYPAPGVKDQTMELKINGHWVGTYTTFEGVNSLTYSVPREYILPGSDSVELRFSKLAKPVGLDERELAMSFFLLKIARIETDLQLVPLD